MAQFRTMVLEMIENRLNMMLSESFQLANDYPKTLDATKVDHQLIAIEILKGISNKKIKSPHMTPAEAKNSLHLLESLLCGNDKLDST